MGCLNLSGGFLTFLWCHMSLGPPPTMKADGFIICPSLHASIHPNIHLFIQTMTAPKSCQAHRGESQGHMSVKTRSTAKGGGGGGENECTHKLLCTNVWARPCVKLLDDQVREMWFKFTQNPWSSAFKAWGLVGYTTAGTTVKEQSSKWLSLPWLTYIWPWQTNPNIENRTYVKTICRRRKAGCGGRASLHLVTDTAVWRETSANMLIHKACRRTARPALFCSLLCQCGCCECIFVCAPVGAVCHAVICVLAGCH